MRVSRDDTAAAIGALLFLKLSRPDKAKLFEYVSANADWGSVAHFSRQALRSVDAARCLSTHFVRHLSVLNDALESQMFIGGAQPCLADFACQIALNAALTAFDDSYKWALCNVCRWYDLLQHTVADASPPAELRCPLVPFDYDAPASLLPVASLQPLMQLTATGAEAAAAVVAPEAQTATPAAVESKPTKREEKKKEDKKKEKKEKPAPAPAEAGQSDISKLDIRVGLIVSADRHPDAEKLYVEKVDVGEEAPRTVVSGLVDFMPAEALQNRRAVLLCNLKPANMRGVQSQAMVLAASNEDHTVVELLSPPEGCAVGERIFFEGHPGEPLAPNVIAKKKVFEAVAPLLSTNAERVATYDGIPFMTQHGTCTVATLTGGKIK